jgi:hypothetical protein
MKDQGCSGAIHPMLELFPTTQEPLLMLIFSIHLELLLIARIVKGFG